MNEKWQFMIICLCSKAAYDLLRSVYEKTGKIPRDVNIHWWRC